MKWKNLSIPIKGGIFGTLAGIIITIILYPISLFGGKILTSSQSNPFPNIPSLFKSISTWIFLNMPFRYGTGYIYHIIGFLTLLLISIVIGILIGLLIEKRKSKKHKKRKSKK